MWLRILDLFLKNPYLCQAGKKVFDLNKNIRNLFRFEKFKQHLSMKYLGISQFPDCLAGYLKEVLLHSEDVTNNFKKSTTSKDKDKECDMHLKSKSN